MAPWMSKAVLAQAASHQEPGLLMSVLFDGELGAGGWMTGPTRAYAVVSDPQAVVTYSLNGKPEVQGMEVWLNDPGQYQIVWKACKGETCHDPFVQYIKIAFMAAQPLEYRDSWRFTGKVTDTRDVSLFGFKARVAKVQSRYVAPWVVQQMDDVRLTDVPLRVGDWVTVSISGSQVSQDQVDWSLCQSEQRDYCAFGSLVDSGLDSPDTDFPLSPSNELIHFNRVSPHWSEALYWKTALIVTPAVKSAELIGLPSEGEYNGNSEGWYRSPVVARMNVSGPARLFYQLDRQPQAQTEDGKVSVSGNGEHQIVWTLENGETVTQFIRIDGGAPLTQWNTDNPTELSSTVDLYGQSRDEGLSGLQETQISFDGGKTWESHPASTPGMTVPADTFSWNFHWDTSAVPNGAYTLLARAVDLAGNMGEPVAWKVRVRNP